MVRTLSSLDYTMSSGEQKPSTALLCCCLNATRRSFIGYSNANYALSEIRDPVRTIKFAAPVAMIAITVVYMLVNIAYYAVVDKDTILNSGRIVAALFFGRLWGQGTERVWRLSLTLWVHGLLMRHDDHRY